MKKGTAIKGSVAAAAVIAAGALVPTVSGAFASDEDPASDQTTATTDNGASDEREPFTPASKGATVGRVPMGKSDTSPPISTFPDFVKVTGDHGRSGYAETAWVFGTKGGPKNPKQAVRWMKNDHHTTIPVYNRAGKKIDTYTMM